VENVREVKPDNKGMLISVPHSAISLILLTFAADKTILVPLTNSLYVPGKLSNPDHVIVDVGTGYFVQKVYRTVSSFQSHRPDSSHQTRAQALTHYQNKVDYVRGNLETLQNTIEKKQDNLNYLMNMMQSKMGPSQQTKS
jgi:prefoldin alpha subunit